MKRLIGIGGIFFKSEDPPALKAWYEKHLGLEPQMGGEIIFNWRRPDEDAAQFTVWAPFPKDTKYFEPSRTPFMINYIVEDLDALLVALKSEGVWIDERREEHEYGRFAWIMDPEGNRIELWEPPKKASAQS
jgi:catechol 2,3-dioxygenase-like lactoylglutathione lyase family enzyme